MDMRDPFIAYTKSNVTDAESTIVFDRFHIMKHMNMALDDVRRMEARIADSKEILKKTSISGCIPQRTSLINTGRGTSY